MNQERKKNIAILMGGDSVERKISIKSGEYFYSNLN
jgi:D-alanine-D-alanine ligase-like ATP-grasp enzyme